jgi:hypothetical protein
VPDVTLRWESWDEFWPDARRLLREDYDEHKRVLRLWKPHEPDADILRELSLRGILLIAVARVNGSPKACCMWMLDVDLESKGSPMAHQGTFYATSVMTRLRLGLRLMTFSIAELRRRGVVEVELKHPVRGRGSRLSSLFLRMGARSANVTYLLKLVET